MSAAAEPPALTPTDPADAALLDHLFKKIGIDTALQRMVSTLATCAGWLERPALLNHLKAFGASLADRQAIANALSQARREAETMYSAQKSIGADVGMSAGVTLDSLNPLFGADSANNSVHPELWVKNAALLSPQLNALREYANVAPVRMRSLSEFHDGKSRSAELKQLLDRHGSDKATRHSYHVVYANVFSQLGADAPLRVLEIGLGTNDPSVPSTMGANGRPGASLRAFRDFLPHAQLFGADVDAKCLFHGEERIKTAHCDQYDPGSLEMMHMRFGSVPYDVVIDDGLHCIGANLNTLLFGLNHVADGGWVVIEDIGASKLPHWQLVDCMLRSCAHLETFVVDLDPQKLYLVRKIGAVAVG